MKNNISFTGILCVLVLSLLSFSKCSSTLPAADSGLATSIKQKIDTKHFTFDAESVTPQRGGKRFLTSPYDVYVSRDSLVAYLPYFGRATSAPINPAEGGIKFTSTDFSYEVTQPKSDWWEILLRPKDNRDVQEMNFTIFSNGTANLQVTSTSRDFISFEGKIR